MMKDQKFGPLPILALTLGGGLCGFALRLVMLRDMSWAFPALALVSVAVVVGLILLVRGMGKRSGLSENLPKSIPAAIGTGLGGAMLGIYFVANLPNTGDLFLTISSIVGLFGAVCLLLQAGLRLGGKSSSVASMITTLALAINLVHWFRGWSADPLLGDYCFKLMACIFSMLASFHMGGFTLQQGKRQMSIFFSMGAVYFSLVCLADPGFLSQVFFGGLAIWLLFGSVNLNKPIPPRRKLGGGYAEPQDTKEEP